MRLLERLDGSLAVECAHDQLNALQISDAVDSGKSQLAALGAATPLLADAMALSMPCVPVLTFVIKESWSSSRCGSQTLHTFPRDTPAFLLQVPMFNYMNWTAGAVRCATPS